MIFGAAPLAADLAGAILAHSLKTRDRVIHKGAVLDDALIAALRAAGHAEVTVARLEPGDVPEEDAARRLGAHFAGPGLRVAAPVHGRVNVFAETRGLFRLDAAAIAALNGLDEAIALGTLPDATPVAPGDMLATLKIVPFAVPGAVMARAASLLGQGAPLRIEAFRPLRTGLVLSRLPQLKDAAIRNTIEATRQRVAARGGALLDPIETPHETAPIRAAIDALLAQGADLVLIAGASAVTDRADVAPAAITAAGGRIDRFGMPVDPGNLLCFGRIGAVPAIVLPGCARSPRLNGIDFVLDRVFAGEPLDDALIASMGIGGLLKDFAPRPEPRVPRATRRTAPKIAVIVLAAGRSSRAAPQNKLLARLQDGRALVAATVDHALAARAALVLVVTGHQDDAVREALTGRPVRFVHAAAFASGMAASLAAGINALPADTAAALICLGDMPLVDAAAIDRMIAAYDPDEGRAIVVPTHRGRRGNPILWDRSFFPEIAALTGDAGARHILARHVDRIAEVEMPDDAVLRDFDTRDALAELKDRP
ncbi:MULTISPECIES: NTP transferase domain-containing protein [Acidiphilium]|uniref:NTP transferase domain-containing protein n=1 Tax=Acidiphilium TaxID=522 RepID=UPI001B8CD924|nr:MULTISPECIES: molybdopterin-binding/glycosyltransferase family 2 protein [Acidiphilium]MBS3023906.1 NTP transferase domain-containing protein [Acidiphilium multivorum]MBU6355509.1 molybdopterin-binding/glycosyltransferase family 2 protein [Rhodospirillales bacterium]